MADPCPRCDAPLGLGGSFCKACGWDASLLQAEAAGEGADLPAGYGSEDDFDYDAFLGQEGLGGRLRGAPLGARALLRALVGLLIAAALVYVFVLR